MTEKVRNKLEYLKECFPGKISLGIEDMAALTGRDIKTVRDMIARNELPGIVTKSAGKAKRLFVIPLINVAEWMAEDNKPRFGGYAR